MTNSTIRWNQVNDTTEDKSLGMTRRCCAAGINVIKALSGKAFEMATTEIGELNAAVTELIESTLGYKPNISNSTLRRHGLLKLEVKDGKGYAIFTQLKYAVKRANADREEFDKLSGYGRIEAYDAPAFYELLGID